LRKRSVGFDAVAWMKRTAISAAAIVAFAMTFAGTVQAETRTLKLYNTHTKERVSITFKKNGRYIPSGLREANRFLRDWRRNEITKIDPELLDLVWEVYQKVRARDYIHVVSSYRSPATNNMLRKRSKGVARNSQHTLGKAMDFYIPGVNIRKLRETGLRKQVGGVGYYPRSGSPFVHLDTGSVRHWPKMSRSQLARVFPNGKTLHIPSDGKPMKGYKIALAESKSGRRSSTRPTIVASNDTSAARNINDRDQGARTLTTRNQSVRSTPAPTPPANVTREAPEGGGNLFASLFGGGERTGNSDATRPGAVGGRQTASQAETVSPVIANPPVPTRKIVDTPEEAPVIAVASSAPELKPIDEQPVQIASAASVPTPAPNTLDGQRAALDAGQPAAASEPLDARFQIARAPAQKPAASLQAAAQAAAEKISGSEGTTVDDPVAAIAAATGTAIPSPAPAPRSDTTLAYASAAPTPPELTRSLRPGTATNQQAAAPRPTAAPAAAATRPSVSGRIPKDQIVDPLAGFASLPDRSEPLLLTGAGTARHQTFAWLSHPNQRQLNNVMKPGNRFVAASFQQDPYGNLRTDRFDGPAIVVLPVRFAR
jgi:uncharacterized protein YcbK (DUF882 family)